MADSDSGCVSAIADDKARGASWRDHIKVHPAADLFPMMSPEELAGLIKDVKDKRGLIHPVLFCDDQLLDGRNRVEAAELSGLLDIECLKDKDSPLRTDLADGIDPYEYVLSANIHRRHLTEEQRRELIAKIIKAKPEASDRTIAKQVKRDHKTVAKVRRKLESTGEVSPVQKRVGADGKQRKSRAPRPKVVAPSPVEHRVTESAEVSVEQRRAETAALDEPAETAVDEVRRRVSCVAKTIRRHVEGLSHSDADRFFATLRDCVDVIELALRADEAAS